MGWWRALSVVLLFMIVSACGSSQELNVSVDGLTYDGTNVFYKGKLAAVLKSNELGYDDGKLVREITYELTDAKFNPQGLAILKFLHEKQPQYEIEVEVSAIKVHGASKK